MITQKRIPETRPEPKRKRLRTRARMSIPAMSFLRGGTMARRS